MAIDDGEHREDLELRVPEGAEISTLVAGQPKKAHLRDVNQNDEVTVTHLDELGDKPGRFVMALEVKSLKEGVGFVSHLPDKSRRLTVAFGHQQNAKKMTLPVAEDCEITLAGQPVTLGDLQLQDRLRFRYDTEFHEILVLRDQTLSQASIQEVWPERGELKISDKTGKERVLQIPADCEITLGGQPAALSDLREYDTVDITCHDLDSKPEASTVLVTRRIVKEDRAALFIGIEKYEDPALAKLSFPIANVQLIQQQLVNRYAFNPDRITVLANPNREELREKTEQFLSAVSRDAQVIVYLCGHVYRAPSGQYLIAARAFHWDQRGATGTPMQWLIDALEKCPSTKKLLLLDTCHPGQGTDSSFEDSPQKVLKSLATPPKTTSVIGNCGEGERGFLLDQGKYTLFAYEIARGFGGPADADRDLTITPQELFAFLQAAFKSRKDIPAGRTQTPFFLGNP